MGRILTLRDLCDRTYSSLSAIYPPGEARWMVRIIFEQLKGWTPVDIAIHSEDEISGFIADKVDRIVGRLSAHEPIQYIFGETRFYGMTLKVTPDVLIPRPETEELVDMIVSDAQGHNDLSVTDLCTGSGCIAVALARNLPFSVVTAVDISGKALAVAKENAALTRTSIRFVQADVLSLSDPGHPDTDIVVSNPPYIPWDERPGMDKNVLDHEPSLALFVPDDDPLEFYRAISKYSIKALRPGGRLYLEINPRFASRLAGMLQSDGWYDIDVLPDMQKKKRFIKATRPTD